MVKRSGHQEMGRPMSAAVEGETAREEKTRRTRQEDMLISSAGPEAGRLGLIQVAI